MMKKYLSIFVLSFLFLSTNSALAVYNASDVIGQRDSSNNAVFTTSAANNGSTVSARGLSSEVRAVKLDTVHHRLFVVDRNNNRVLVYNLDSSNNLLDTDADNVFGQVDLTATASSCTTATGLNSPTGAEYDSANNRLFVAMTNSGSAYSRIVVYDLSSGITDGMAAVNVLGQANLTTCNSRVSTASNVYFPFDMKYDTTTGLLYVADLSRNRALVFDARPASSAPMTVCGATTTGIVDNMDASCVLGQPNFSTVSSGNTIAKMNGTFGFEIDTTNHRLYVSEYASNRIKVYDTSALATSMDASYVLGQTDFSGATSGVTQSKFNSPTAMAFDATTGLLYVTDENNHRVMVFDVSGTISNGMSASYILGADDFTTINSGPTASLMGVVFGVAIDTNNKNLFVVDKTNDRVLLFKPTIAIQSSTLNSGKVTRTYSESISISDNQQTPSLELVSGTLPTGISISGTSLVGRATEFGTYNFVLKAVDTGIHGIFSSDDTNFSIDIQYLPSTSGSTASSFGSKVNNNTQSSIPVSTENDTSIKVCAAFGKPVKFGRNNDKDEVKLWQQFLNNSEGEKLAVDGGYGLKSKLAVARFQKKHNLGSDGIIGPKTEEEGNKTKTCY